MMKLEAEGRRGTIAPRLVHFTLSVLEVQAGSAANDDYPVVVDRGLAEDRLRKGHPVLCCDDLHLDRAAVSRMFTRILSVFTEHADLLGDVPIPVNDRVPQLDNSTIEAWFDHKPLASPAVEGGLDGLWWDGIIDATLRPFLHARAVAAVKTVDMDMWRRGYCPVCGSAPDFSVLESDGGARRLVCSRCDAEWLFQRLQCPFCDNSEADKLGYFVDSSGKYRLYVCDQCRGYLKAIDLRSAGGPASPVVERLLTLDLDIQARNQGYFPGATKTVQSLTGK